MDHVAIMRKSWGFTEKILRGEKTIESRWYMGKRVPWDRIAKGDVVYFKNSGEPVFFRATVSRVFQFENLTPQRVKEILERYGKEDGVSREQMPFFFKLFKDKRYCILVFLVRPQRVRQFFINKKGFGAMASWISISSVNSIKY